VLGNAWDVGIVQPDETFNLTLKRDAMFFGWCVESCGDLDRGIEPALSSSGRARGPRCERERYPCCDLGHRAYSAAAQPGGEGTSPPATVGDTILL
jgi:hypothetical protein